MRVTIHDVAKRAGVSISSVSLALNNKEGISEKTRKKIVAAADELSYPTPNILTKPSKVKTIAVFLSGLNYSYFNSTFFSDILRYVSVSLTPSKYSTIMLFSNSSEDTENFRHLVHNNALDAMILIGRMSASVIETYAPTLPCVYINRPSITGKNAYSVYADNEKAAYLVTRHLIDLGHKDIAFMGYIPNIASTTERFNGYKKALSESGIHLNLARVYPTEHYEETGFIETRKLVTSGIKLPTGIVCGNDLIAIGAMQALWDSGLSIPDDISITGIHNLPHTDLIKVPLTTVKIPHDLLGTQAAALIMDILNGKEPKKLWRNDVELIVRKSTGQAKL